MTFEVQRSSLALGQRLGRGGQARGVYRLEQDVAGLPTRLVYKEYKDQILRQYGASIRHGIPALIRAGSHLPPPTQRRLDGRTVWPLAVALDGHEATGVLMREFPLHCIVDLSLVTGVERRPHELQLYLQEPNDIASLGLVPPDERERAQVAYQVAHTLLLLHSLGIVVGDFSASNVLVARSRSRGLLPLLIDCDSYRVNGSGPHLPQPNTPDWHAPEYLALDRKLADLLANHAGRGDIASTRAERDVLTQKSDVYKWGLLFLRLFHRGEDHAVVRSSSSAVATIRGLFKSRADHLLAALAKDPAQRPTSAELVGWFEGKK